MKLSPAKLRLLQYVADHPDGMLSFPVKPQAVRGRVLRITPHNLALIVAHEGIRYGSYIEQCDKEGYVLLRLKRAIFEAVRDLTVQNSTASLSNQESKG